MGDQKEFVYFFQGSETGLIKIGYSRDVKKRLKTCQSGSPENIKLLGVMAGDQKLEKKLHKQFDFLRTRNEWFQDKEVLRKYILEHCSKEDNE